MDSVPPFRFGIVMRCQYFLYFGVLGIFLPYFNLYCHELGFSGTEIGAISALRSLCLVLFSVLWSLAADRYDARRPVYWLCLFAAAAVWPLYLGTDDFAGMAAATLLYGLFFSPIISFMEAFTLEGLGAEKRKYGPVRLWGTVAFILSVTTLGPVIDRTGVRIVLWLILAGGLLQAVTALAVPRIAVDRDSPFAGSARFLRERRTLGYLGAAFLMLASHGTFYGFFSIHLQGLGFGGTFIGFAWALAPVSEILVMVYSDRIFRRFAVESVLRFAFGAAALRWLVLCLTAEPAVVVVSQVLHAATYGAFHISGLLYIDRIAPDRSKTLAQSVNNALTYGLGMMAGLFLNGFFYERIGPFALFGFSALTAAAGGMLLHFSAKSPTDSARDGSPRDDRRANA